VSIQNQPIRAREKGKICKGNREKGIREYDF
jgi:hypothetical protein